MRIRLMFGMALLMSPNRPAFKHRIVRLPVSFRFGAVPCSTIRTFPSDCVDVFPTANESAKQADFLVGRKGRNSSCWRGLNGIVCFARHGDAILGKESAKALVLGAEAV